MWINTCSLNSLAISRASSKYLSMWPSCWDRNMSRWLLISPPKIFWAVSWLKSTTSGRDCDVTNFLIFSSVISASKSARPSSNWNMQVEILYSLPIATDHKIYHHNLQTSISKISWNANFVNSIMTNSLSFQKFNFVQI